MVSNRFFKLFFLYAAGGFLLVVAMLFHQEHLYLMAATLLLIPLVSRLLGRALASGLACERTEPSPCSEGEMVIVTLNLTAVGLLPKFFLRAQDRLPRWLRPAGASSLILQLWPGESQAITYTLEPEMRGIYTLGPTQVTTTDPLGFFTYTQTLSGTAELVVYPRVIPLRQLAALDGAGAWGRESRDGGGTRGAGLDFHGVREYRYGDELRRVHWRTTARTGKLAVMEYNQGATGDVTLALDLNRQAYEGTGEGPESALEYAVRIAVSVAAYLLRQGYGVCLLTPATVAAPLKLHGLAEMPRLLEALAHARADAPLTLARVLQNIAAETVIFITPDADSGALGAALSAARARGARHMGFALDAASFGPSGQSLQERVGDSHLGDARGGQALTQIVRRGDDLAHAIEGSNYARR